MANVFQLTHIARKGELIEHELCRFGDAFGLDAQLLCTLLQKVARQHRDVFASLTQRRQAQANHIQAVEQVLTEHAIFDAFFQVLVSGGDHAHIGLDGAVTAHAVIVAIAQHPQQTGLQVKRHVANFIQKERAALGLFKASTTCGLRAGEGAALVAKQFTFQQILRNGCGVDGHKWPFVARVSARRVLVQGACNQFFATATLACDHDRDIALTQAPNGTKHILHGRGLAQHFWRGILQLALGLLALALVHSASNQLNRFGQIKGLGQVLESAALKGRDRAVQIRERRHDDDGQIRQTLFHFGEQV